MIRVRAMIAVLIGGLLVSTVAVLIDRRNIEQAIVSTVPQRASEEHMKHGDKPKPPDPRIVRGTEGFGSDENVWIQVTNVLPDYACEALFFRADIENRSAHPIFVVANDFTFKNLFGGDYCNLAIKCSERRIDIDLSHVYPSAAGMNWHRESGALMFPPEVIEIAPGHRISHAYSFHFPLRPMPRVQDLQVVNLPKSIERIQVRFGYASETMDQFMHRELADTDTVVSWQEKVVSNWQKTVIVETRVAGATGN